MSAPEQENHMMTAAEAEQYLQSALGEREGYWRTYLQNNRRTERNPRHHIPYQVVRGRPRYEKAHLDQHIALVREDFARRGKVAGSVHEVFKAVGGCPTGRPFVATVSPQIEEGEGIGFLQLLISEPLLVYRLDLEQARQVAAEITEAVNVLERALGSQR